MIQSTKSKEAQAYVRYAAIRKYFESYRKFLKIAEQRALKISPEQKYEWQILFKLQRLLSERQTARFEHLFGSNKSDRMTMRSLSSIEERIEKGWSASEEAGLKEKVRSYCDAAREIDDLRAKLVPGMTAKGWYALNQDSQYLDARLALSERVKKLMEQMRD